MRSLSHAAVFAVALSLLGSCARQPKTANTDGVETLRKKAESSADSTLVSRWLLAELITPGGSAERAARA